MPKRHIAVFDKPIFSVRLDQQRWIVARVGEDECFVRRVKNAVDGGYELIVIDRIAKQIADL